MNRRAARLEEAAQLSAIAHAAKRHWGYPEAWIQHWRLTLTITPEYIARNPTFVAEDFYRKMGLVTVGREDASLDGHERFLPLMEKVLGA